jgi:hypothetical protein
MNVEPPETLVIIESILYKSNGFAIVENEIQTAEALIFTVKLSSNPHSAGF